MNSEPSTNEKGDKTRFCCYFGSIAFPSKKACLRSTKPKNKLALLFWGWWPIALFPLKLVFKLSFVDWVAVLLLLFAYDCALDHLLDFPVPPTSSRHHEGASRTCEWETLAALSVNKGCCSHQAITPDGEPWGDSGWKQDACHQAVNHCSTPNGAPRGDTG